MTVFLHSSTYSLLKRRTYYGFCTQIMVFTFFRATAVSRQPWSHNTVVVLEAKLPNLQEVQVLKWTLSHFQALAILYP